MYVHQPHEYLAPLEAGRGHWMNPLELSLNVETKHWSSVRTASALNCWYSVLILDILKHVFYFLFWYCYLANLELVVWFWMTWNKILAAPASCILRLRATMFTLNRLTRKRKLNFGPSHFNKIASFKFSWRHFVLLFHSWDIWFLPQTLLIVHYAC